MNRIKNSLIANALKRAGPEAPTTDFIQQANPPTMHVYSTSTEQNNSSEIGNSQDNTSLDEMFKTAFEGALNEYSDIFSMGANDWMLSEESNTNDSHSRH